MGRYPVLPAASWLCRTDAYVLKCHTPPCARGEGLYPGFIVAFALLAVRGWARGINMHDVEPRSLVGSAKST